jgi:transcriptional regulator of acetoin/glycerol metabolism
MFELQRFLQEIPGHAPSDERADPSGPDAPSLQVWPRALLPFKEAKALLVERFEREYLLQLLRRCAGNITRAGRESGMHRKSIERLVKRYQLDTRPMRRRRGGVSICDEARP